MLFSSHRKLTAWLGLLAIWLAVLMPVVSQSAQRHDPALSFSICVPGDEHVVYTVTVESDTPTHAQADLTACGYCGLLANHVPIPFVVAFQSDTTSWTTIHPQAKPVTPALARAFTATLPRAPPALFS